MRRIEARIKKLEKIIAKEKELINLDELYYIDFMKVIKFLEGDIEAHKLGKNSREILTVTNKDLWQLVNYLIIL